MPRPSKAAAEVVGLPQIARVLGERWSCMVTQFAVASFCLLGSDPLLIARVRRRRRLVGVIQAAGLDAWADRQKQQRPELLAEASKRGPRADATAALRLQAAAAPRAAASPPLVSRSMEVPPMAADAGSEAPLSGMEAITAHLARRRPVSIEAVRKWRQRSRDPLPVTSFGRGARVVAKPRDLDAWLDRQERKAARAAG